MKELSYAMNVRFGQHSQSAESEAPARLATGIALANSQYAQNGLLAILWEKGPNA